MHSTLSIRYIYPLWRADLKRKNGLTGDRRNFFFECFGVIGCLLKNARGGPNRDEPINLEANFFPMRVIGFGTRDTRAALRVITFAIPINPMIYAQRRCASSICSTFAAPVSPAAAIQTSSIHFSFCPGQDPGNRYGYCRALPRLRLLARQQHPVASFISPPDLFCRLITRRGKAFEQDRHPREAEKNAKAFAKPDGGSEGAQNMA